MPATVKRQNFNVTAEEEAELNRLREALGAASTKDALLRAARLMLTLTQEVREGSRVYLADRQGQQTRLLLPDIEASRETEWQYLAPRPQSSRRQFYIKGHRLTAGNVYFGMQTNEWTVEQAAEEWNLPVEAVLEAIRYCEANEDLIHIEADEDKRILLEVATLFPPAGRK